MTRQSIRNRLAFLIAVVSLGAVLLSFALIFIPVYRLANCVELGAHFGGDVILGLAAGLGSCVAFLGATRLVSEETRSGFIQVYAVIAGPLVIVAMLALVPILFPLLTSGTAMRNSCGISFIGAGAIGSLVVAPFLGLATSIITVRFSTRPLTSSVRLAAGLSTLLWITALAAAALVRWSTFHN